MMHVAIAPQRRNAGSLSQQLKEGWQYVAGSRPVRTILLLFALISLMGMPFTVLMPVFASNVLHGGAYTLGFLLRSVGSGRAGLGDFAGIA